MAESFIKLSPYEDDLLVLGGRDGLFQNYSLELSASKQFRIGGLFSITGLDSTDSSISLSSSVLNSFSLIDSFYFGTVWTEFGNIINIQRHPFEYEIEHYFLGIGPTSLNYLAPFQTATNAGVSGIGICGVFSDGSLLYQGYDVLSLGSYNDFFGEVNSVVLNDGSNPDTDLSHLVFLGLNYSVLNYGLSTQKCIVRSRFVNGLSADRNNKKDVLRNQLSSEFYNPVLFDHLDYSGNYINFDVLEPHIFLGSHSRNEDSFLFRPRIHCLGLYIPLSSNMEENISTISYEVSSNGKIYDYLPYEVTVSPSISSNYEVFYNGSLSAPSEVGTYEFYISAYGGGVVGNYFGKFQISSFSATPFMWYDAERKVFNAVSGGSSPIDEGSVLRWEDVALPAQNLTVSVDPAGAGIYRATSINGKPDIFVTGTNSTYGFISNSAITVNGLSGMTMMAVVKTDTVLDDTTYMRYATFGFSETGSWGIVGLKILDSRINWRFGTGQSLNDNYWTRPSPLGGAPSLTTVVKNGTSEYLYVNGVLVSTKTGKLPNIANTSSNFKFGQAVEETYPWKGGVGEILIFNSALTDTQRIEYETYLINKWGL